MANCSGRWCLGLWALLIVMALQGCGPEGPREDLSTSAQETYVASREACAKGAEKGLRDLADEFGTERATPGALARIFARDHNNFRAEAFRGCLEALQAAERNQK